MSDDDLTEEEERRMAANLMIGRKKSAPIVELRKSRSKVKIELVTLRFVQHVDRLTKEWLWCVVEQKGDKGWFEIEKYEDRKKAQIAAENYQRAGDKVERCETKVW